MESNFQQCPIYMNDMSIVSFEFQITYTFILFRLFILNNYKVFFIFIVITQVHTSDYLSQKIDNFYDLETWHI